MDQEILLKDVYRGLVSVGENDKKILKHKSIKFACKKYNLKAYEILKSVTTGKPVAGRIFSVKM